MVDVLAVEVVVEVVVNVVEDVDDSPTATDAADKTHAAVPNFIILSASAYHNPKY